MNLSILKTKDTGFEDKKRCLDALSLCVCVCVYSMRVHGKVTCRLGEGLAKHDYLVMPLSEVLISRSGLGPRIAFLTNFWNNSGAGDPGTLL